MSRKWVVNSSPLIVLAKISRAHLLQDLCEDLIVPSGVVYEINQGPADDPARDWLQKRATLWTRDVPVSPEQGFELIPSC